MKQKEEEYIKILDSLTAREQSVKEEFAEMERKLELLTGIDELEESVSINSCIY